MGDASPGGRPRPAMDYSRRERGDGAGRPLGEKKDFHLLGTDLFGDEIKADPAGRLRERFDFPPFSVLNAREGAWQERKRAWIACGIQSELGRGAGVTWGESEEVTSPKTRADILASLSDEQKIAFKASEPGGGGGPNSGYNRGRTALKAPEEDYDYSVEAPQAGSGTSIFDPVLTELMYRWFCPQGGLILDPFAGGSVRGIVAGLLGYRYYGIDLSAQQIAANEAQRQVICPEADITWHVGDSNVLLKDAPEADFVFSCPPYGDLERYSDDPSDLSTMSWEQFVGLYRAIIRKAINRLRPNRFACFVVGEYRDKQTGFYRGFVPLTCASFMAAGAPLYNEAVLLTAVGSLPIRVGKQFEVGRKLGKTHQNIIICCKGDSRQAVIALKQGSPVTINNLRKDTITLTAAAPAVERSTLAQFLDSEPIRVDLAYTPDEPPDLSGVDEVVLNFATTGLDWHAGDRPCGVTVATMDGRLVRFLPFRFAGGNLDEAVVKRWMQEQIRGKKIVNSKTKFDVHMAREWGVDLEEQGCTFSDVQHTAALLDDHRKKFALDVLVQDYLPDEPIVGRLDERIHHQYHAAAAAERERHTVRLVSKLLDAMRPRVEAEGLQQVQVIEDAVIPAVVEMERNGSPIDVELLEQYGRECGEAHDALMWEISREAGFAFEHTASGWKRLIESLRLPVPNSFSEDVLREVDHPLIRKGQRAAQYASLNSKIFKAYPEHIVDGVLRYSINQLVSDDGGTVSGRFSIGLVQQVPNADNHAAAFGDAMFPRRLFISGSGQYLEADAEQIEFRLLVHYSGNAKLLQAYRDDPLMSFHKEMQKMLMVYKPDMLYAHTKNYNFAAQYGARSIKLAAMMGFITAKEGEEIRTAKRWNDPRLSLIHEIEAAYKRAHPEAGELLNRAAHLAKPRCDDYCKLGDTLHRQYPHRGYVKTLLGRRSRFPNAYKTYIGLNRVLQGTGADIMKIKLAELHRERRRTGFIMRITNHDAVLGDATTPETAKSVGEILDHQSVPLKVPILWSVGTGRSWADCK